MPGCRIVRRPAYGEDASLTASNALALSNNSKPCSKLMGLLRRPSGRQAWFTFLTIVV